MCHHFKTATVFGGTGFIGAQIVRELARQDYTVKIATRVPERAYFLRPCGVVGQIVPLYCDYSDRKSIEDAVSGSDVVVNCIGLLVEKKKGAFEKVHVDIPKTIAKACAKLGVKRFVHISSLGVYSRSQYGKTKLDGEKAVLKEYPKATILRPSVVFGPQDEFFNMFAEMARYVPILPLIGGGKTKFQPVYVGDIADAVMSAITIQDVREDSPCGKIYELGGPEVVTFRDIYEILFKYTGRRRALMSLPWGLAKLQSRFMAILPNPPLTPDQVESLKDDNIVTAEALTIENLGIEPTGMAQILPGYLERFRPGGKFANKKTA